MMGVVLSNRLLKRARGLDMPISTIGLYILGRRVVLILCMSSTGDC
jgi:hypothetical protein